MTQRKTLTVDETAAITGLSRQSTYDAISRGELPSIRVGRRILIPRAKLEELLGGPIEAGTTVAERRKAG